MFENRIKNAISLMHTHSLDQMIITDPISILYLTGEYFDCGERCLALLITSQGSYTLLLNELFNVKAYDSLSLTLYTDSDDPIALLTTKINAQQKMGIDGEWPSKFLMRLMSLLPSLKVVDTSFVLETLRSIKDFEECQKMLEASALNDSVMEDVAKLLTQNLSENKVAKHIATFFDKKGASKLSFNPIIAYGENTTNPHHEPTETFVKNGDSIIVDMGCVLNGYCSDMTRTFFYQSVSNEARHIYETVLKANLEAIKAVKPGIAISDIDGVARKVISDAGYGEYFTHRTGHGIGLCVHELPSVSSSDTTILKAGMCFSIEPGIYKPGVCGVRIEDLVLVTENGCTVLNNFSKELTLIS